MYWAQIVAFYVRQGDASGATIAVSLIHTIDRLMPELPEVETTVNGIRPFTEGRKVAGVIVRQRQLRWPVSRGLSQKLVERLSKVSDAVLNILCLNLNGAPY